jgi:hypothetical protein
MQTKPKHSQLSKGAVDTNMKTIAKKLGRPRKMDKAEEIIVENTDCNLQQTEDTDEVFDDILVLRKCLNPDFIVGRLDGFAVNIRCGRKVSHRLVGKNISIKKSKEEEIYHYLP